MSILERNFHMKCEKVVGRKTTSHPADRLREYASDSYVLASRIKLIPLVKNSSRRQQALRSPRASRSTFQE
jgi:hypothetical protein